jgi:hypothetical protein
MVRRHKRKRSVFQRLRKFLRELLIRLGLIRSRRPLHSSELPTTDVNPIATQTKVVQPLVQQEVKTVDRGSVAVGSIANVAGDVYIGGRPAPGIPLQVPPLPTYYVDRLAIRERLKSDLLGTDVAQAGTLVVSAVYGLGGIGKSVLAAAIAGEREVQEKFPDGVLWVTLGQEPQVLEELGNWIQAVGDRDYKPTTIPGASSHLRSLLFEKQMLLVVDDVWEWAEGEPFQMGGKGCRVLVTTREAHIPGAVKIDLEVMDDHEAIELLEGYLKRPLTEADRLSALGLKAEVAGLPLALELAAAQIADGLGWDELLRALREEVASLEILDAPDFDESKQEKDRKKRSLRASFNLSLKRLTDKNLKQFVMMGILPEDVSVGAEAMAVLWDVPIEMAKKNLRELRRRSLLLDGVKRGETKTYRMHDLVRDTAMKLIPVTLGIRIDEAHNLFLSRCRTIDCTWFSLQNNGYIHSHLTWHLEKAGREAEIHELMMASDERGRNAWFETCEKLGQPAIFVQDMTRAWRLAEEIYSGDSCQSIVLQCRYALVATTLNDLAENLPIGLIAEFVRRDFWSIEQAWAYIEQIQDQKEISHAILTLAPYLSKSLLQIAANKARLLADEDCYADILSHLVQIDHVYFAEALEAVRLMKPGLPRTMALSRLAKIDPAYFSEVVDAARSVQFLKSFMWIRLVETDLAYFSAALEEAELIQEEWALLNRGMNHSPDKFIEELETARSSHHNKSHQTNDLSQTDSSQSTNLPEEDELFEENSLLEEDFYCLLQLLQDEEAMRDECLWIDTLIDLAQFDRSYFDRALQVARSLDNESDEIDKPSRASVLIGLSRIDNADFHGILEVARLIQDEISRVSALSLLAKVNNSYFSEALESVRALRDESSRARQLVDLAQINNSFFVEALETAQSIRFEPMQEMILIRLTQVDGADYTRLLEAGRLIWGHPRWVPGREKRRRISEADMLSHIAQADHSYFIKALEAVRSIQDANSRADGLIRLAQIDNAYFPEALEAALSIQNECKRAYRLIRLAQIDNTYFSKALEAVQSIQDDESGHTHALSDLAQIDNADFTQLLKEARLVQSESNRVSVLSELAKFAPKEFLPQIYQSITEITYIPTRTKALNSYFSRVPPVHEDWTTHLHLLAHRKRADLMGDLATLYPAIIHLGGEAAMRGVVEEMRRVCGQWP